MTMLGTLGKEEEKGLKETRDSFYRQGTSVCIGTGASPSPRASSVDDARLEQFNNIRGESELANAGPPPYKDEQMYERVLARIRRGSGQSKGYLGSLLNDSWIHDSTSQRVRSQKVTPEQVGERHCIPGRIGSENLVIRA
ncbi:hypothetical protein ANO14919_131510 [Xylariales sp. No.14919]|nr:hypothetical protein ANO14919_131510 [Xylariales sp. No.14919]